MDIRHSFVFEAPARAIAEALTQQDHIRGWWTREATVEDGTCRASWSGHGWSVELQVARDDAGNAVRWHCTRSNMQDTTAWEGTDITFALVPQGSTTRVEFVHEGYRESPCRDACHAGWAFFVGTSLRRYVETGKGMPYPEMQDTRTA